MQQRAGTQGRLGWGSSVALAWLLIGSLLTGLHYVSGSVGAASPPLVPAHTGLPASDPSLGVSGGATLADFCGSEEDDAAPSIPVNYVQLQDGEGFVVLNLIWVDPEGFLPAAPEEIRMPFCAPEEQRDSTSDRTYV